MTLRGSEERMTEANPSNRHIDYESLDLHNHKSKQQGFVYRRNKQPEKPPR